MPRLSPLNSCPGAVPIPLAKIHTTMKVKLLFLLLFGFSFAYGQKYYQLSNHYLVVKGTSNLHAWQSKSNEVRANGTIHVEAGTLKAINSLYVEIPVKSIKSEKGSIMDGKTYDALKADNFPNISFKVDRINGINKSGDGFDVNAACTLTIAGASRKIDMYVRAKVGADGSVTFSGSKKLLMTDYNIKPPTALMGTLTTGNEVEIAFQVTLK
jgi:polyisoprenoid-binding protein YceI